MSYNIGSYNRYVTFETPTDVNTKGSLTRTWASAFNSFADKVDETSITNEDNGQRTTLSKSTWKFPYNSAIVKDGRFYEGNATTSYYYVTGLIESIYQTEYTVEAELRA